VLQSSCLGIGIDSVKHPLALARLGLTVLNFAVDGRLGEAIALFERTLARYDASLFINEASFTA
jgi:hypothetical protein